MTYDRHILTVGQALEKRQLMKRKKSEKLIYIEKEKIGFTLI